MQAGIGIETHVNSRHLPIAGQVLKGINEKLLYLVHRPLLSTIQLLFEPASGVYP
jgi:hypothetical protein